MVNKVEDLGFELNQQIGRWTIYDENLVMHSGRKQIHVKCVCGNCGIVRHDRLKNGKTLGCKKCQKMSYYPETRISSALHYKGLHKVFLNKLGYNSNTNRGLSKKINVNITIEELYEILEFQNFKCALTGIPLNILHLSPSKSNSSIDRIDSNKNYSKDNIQWVLKDVNKMKNDLNNEYFIKLCTHISKNHGNLEPSFNLND